MHSSFSTQPPGINIQAPWAEYILSGKKTVETRFYPLPQKYIGKAMAIIETPGKDGKFKARVVGLVIFGQPFLYRTGNEFYRDSAKHKVTKNSPFCWSANKGKKKWGWPIIRVERCYFELPPGLKKGILYTARVPLPRKKSWPMID